VSSNQITPTQLKAARGLLRISQIKLAAMAGVATSTLADFERNERTPTFNNLVALRRACEQLGIKFIPGGVKLKGDP
jgi:transcriptional regulator with XRE-family HTH domain